MIRFVPGMLVVCLWVCTPGAAWAFSIETGFTRGCHEGISYTAYVQANPDFNLSTMPFPADGEWEEVADFLLEAIDAEAATREEKFFLFSFFAGLRSPDTDGHSSVDLNSLRKIHASPTGQYEHCLRAIDDDYEEGNAAAFEGCFQFILDNINIAGDLLRVPPDEQLIYIDFALDYYGTFEMQAWGPAYYLGRGIHALQDSFTHTLRSADLRTIVSFMNYAEAIGGTLEEGRDGMAHSDSADTCDETGREVVSAAIEATADLFRATAVSTQRVDEGEVEAAIRKWFNYQEGCTTKNNYCNSPWVSRARADPTDPVLEETFGCEIGVSRGWMPPPYLLFISVLAFWRHRRRR